MGIIFLYLIERYERSCKLAWEKQKREIPLILIT